MSPFNIRNIHFIEKSYTCNISACPYIKIKEHFILANGHMLYIRDQINWTTSLNNQLPRTMPSGTRSGAPLHRILAGNNPNISYIYIYTLWTSAVVMITSITVTAAISLSGTRNLSNASTVISIIYFTLLFAPVPILTQILCYQLDSDFPIRFDSRCTEIFFYLSHSWVTPLGLSHCPECYE